MVVLRREHEEAIIIEGHALPWIDAVPFLAPAHARSAPRTPRKPRTHQAPNGRDSSATRYQAVRTLHMESKLGQRKQRRWDNLFSLKAKLQSLMEESSHKEKTDEPIVRSAQSGFAELFKSMEAMKLWDTFQESTPEEQELVLKLSNCHIGEASVDLGNSPMSRYLRVERSIRAALRRRHLPMGLLQRIEADIVTAFASDHDSVVVTTLEDSFSRLMQHGICQYLGLKSTSTDAEGRRITTIRNPTPELGFDVPTILLSAVLEHAKS